MLNPVTVKMVAEDGSAQFLTQHFTSQYPNDPLYTAEDQGEHFGPAFLESTARFWLAVRAETRAMRAHRVGSRKEAQ